MHITIFSVKGFTGEALREKLEARLLHHHIVYELTEVHHVDRFIQEGLHSVPAIEIDSRIFIHPHDGSLDETVEQVMEYVLTEKLKSVLVPIDFSAESLHALKYACMMAEHNRLGLTLVHIHQPVYDPVSAGALDVQLHQETLRQLEELVRQIEADNESRGIYMPVHFHLEVGEASSSLIQMSHHDRFEMIVMSTRNADNFFRRLFGTISSKVSRHSHIPVLVIPPEADITFPAKMVVGFTEELLMDGSLDFILTFGGNHQVIFDFVNVTDDPKSFLQLKSRLDEKLQPHRDVLTGYHVRSVHKKERPVHEVLFHYTQEVRAGLMVLISHHRGFLETLVHSSVTEKVLRHPSTPVMIIHHPA